MPENRGVILLSKRQHWLRSFDLLQCVYLDYFSHYLVPVRHPLIRSPSSCRLWARRGKWDSTGAGMGPHCCCGHPVPCKGLVQDPGTSAWGEDRCWIPTQLVVVQPWFMGVLASHLLCWTSSSPSQSLAPSCRYLHSRPKFRKNWLSPQLPVAADIFLKAPVKHSSPKNHFRQNK